MVVLVFVGLSVVQVDYVVAVFADFEPAAAAVSLRFVDAVGVAACVVGVELAVVFDAVPYRTSETVGFGCLLGAETPVDSAAVDPVVLVDYY